MRSADPLRSSWVTATGCLVAMGQALLAGPMDLPGVHPTESPLLIWDHVLTLKTGAGYKNNALLAAFTPADTALITGGIDFFLTRLPIDGHQFTVFFSGEERRYLDPIELRTGDTADHELLLLSQVAYKYYGNHVIPGLNFTHLHARQVFDATDLEGVPGTVRASGHALILTPSLRYPLPRGFYVQGDYVVTRQLFQSPVSSYWEYGPKAALGWQYTTNGSVEVSFQHTDRPFDTRLQTDALGQPLSDTSLTTTDTRYEATWKQVWYAPLKLQTTLRGFTLSRLENGDGFSDYDRLGGSVGAQFEYGKWAFRGLARWSTFDFALQIVSVFDPIPRTREETEFEARIEYRWTPRFRTYAEYMHERQHSNVQADNYHANTWQAGLELDF